MMFRKRSGAIAAVVTGATLVPLVAFGGVGFAKNAPSASQYQYPPSASEYQYSPSANQYKVRVCHYTHSKKHPFVIINISKSAWLAHQKRGDVLLPEGTTCPPKVSTTAATTHGNSGSDDNDAHGNNGQGNNGHGNNGHHGKP